MSDVADPLTTKARRSRFRAHVARFTPAALCVLLAVARPGPWMPAASACDYMTLRDAAFDQPRDVHWLCVMARAGDPAGERIHGQLASWFAENGKGLNLEIVRVVADDPEVRWRDYGIPSAPPSLPVVVLVGRRSLQRESFIIDHWEPAPSVEQLNALRSSPVRETIAREVVRKLAVLLYVSGTGGGDGGVAKVLDAVVQTWSEKEPLGLSIVRVDRSNERERLLLSFAGASGADWVAGVFGRGKFMTPPLEGDEITEARLNDLIEILRSECTCLRSPASLGVDIPMVWSDSLDAMIQPLRSLKEYPPVEGDPGVDEAGTALSRSRAMRSIAGSLAGMVLVVGVAATALLWRSRRREA